MVDGRGVYVCDQWRTCRFVVAETLEAQVKSTYGRYGMSEDDLFESLAGVDLLVLDDLGRQRLSAWEASTIYRVINDRYNALRRTVVTSNYSISGLAARIEEQTDTEMAESLASRIAGMCDAVEVKGKDLRLKGNEDR
jgi:DNA replication protein DnaC/primosomal protein DnaI